MCLDAKAQPHLGDGAQAFNSPRGIRCVWTPSLSAATANIFILSTPRGELGVFGLMNAYELKTGRTRFQLPEGN